MKNKIKKVLVLTGLVATMTVGLAGCGKKTCDICHEEGRCKTVEFLGNDVNVCKDCQKDLKSLGSLLK